MRRRRTLVRFFAAIAVVAAGSAVVGHAAGLNVSSAKLGTVAATVPADCTGTMTVKAAHSTPADDVTTITPTLSACTGAASGDVLYVTIQKTTPTPASVVGYASCTLNGTSCTTPTLSGGPVPYATTDDYSLVFTTSPGAAGTTATGDGLHLNSQYLTLRTCSAITGTKLNAGTATC
jgi:hypothetical protein